MRFGLLLAAPGISLATLAQAQDYPKGPVRMPVPFPPGSATDLAARVMGQQLQNALGKPFVIENKAGAQSRSLAEFIACVKQRPGKVTAGTGRPVRRSASRC
jgi:hypothetical protein